MYRHWNTGVIIHTAISLSLHLTEVQFPVKRILWKDRRFESPLSPYFDEGEISWSPDGKSIAFTSKRLNGKADAVSTNSDIFLYNIETGKEINISEGNKGYDRFPVFSPDGSKIAYQSMERDGYEADLDRLFVYNINEGTKTWVSKEWNFDVSDIAWSDNKTLYFVCSHLGTSQIFKTDLQGGEVYKGN